MRSFFIGLVVAFAATSLSGAALAQRTAPARTTLPSGAGRRRAQAARASRAPISYRHRRPRRDERAAREVRPATTRRSGAPCASRAEARGDQPARRREGRADPADDAVPGLATTTAGEAWRQVRNHWIIPYGGALILIVVLAIAIYYWAKGPIGGHEPDTGRVIQRFTPFERAAHWTNAIAFCVLAVSGLVMAFGKFFLLPVIGGTLFGWLTYVLKTAHNFAGPLFAVSLVIVFFTFLRDNFPSRGDLAWLLSGGGLFGGSEPPSHRFNAGEKIVFWGGVLVLGRHRRRLRARARQAACPGLDVPARRHAGRAHDPRDRGGADDGRVHRPHLHRHHRHARRLQGDGTGYVDEAWAREHHRLWYEDIRAGKIPAQRSAPPRAAPAARRLTDRQRRRHAPSPSPAAAPARLLAGGVLRQAAAAGRRGQGQGRRDGGQGGVDRQGRRLPAVPGEGHASPTAYRARSQAAGKAGLGADRDAGLRRPRPLRRRRSRRRRASRSRPRARIRRPAGDRAAEHEATRPTRRRSSADPPSAGAWARPAHSPAPAIAAADRGARAAHARDRDPRRVRRGAHDLDPRRARADGLRRQARAGHADDAGRAARAAGARLPAQPAPGRVASTRSNRSPSTGTSTRPR